MEYPQLERVGMFCMKCNQVVCICKNLKAFNKKELLEFKISCERAADAIELIVNTGVQNAMNQIH